MDNDFISRVDQFNRELSASVAAGIGVDIGLESGFCTSRYNQSSLAAEKFSQRLNVMREALALRVNLRQPPEDAVEQEASLTPRYRAALQCWMACDNPTVVMEAISRSAADHQSLDRGIRLALSRTYMIVVLAFMGLAATSFWLAPEVEATYKQLQIEPDSSARWLAGIRTWLPIWATVVMTALLVIGIILHKASSSWVDWVAMRVPQTRRYAELKKRARFADQMALLIRHNLTIGDSIPIAASLAGNNDCNNRMQGIEPTIQLPLIQWATDEPGNQDRCVRSLRTAATIYRQIAQRQENSWTKAIPAVCGTLVCGAFVLLYAVTLFGPIADLLNNITSPTSIIK